MITILHVFWALLLLVVLGFGIYGLVIGSPILAITCFAIDGIGGIFVYNDVKKSLAKTTPAK